MDWILEHLRIVIIAIVVIVWFLRSIAGARRVEDAGQPPAGRSMEDTTEAERTRQIQEEIRRRILARQRGEAPAPPSATPPPLPGSPVVVYEDVYEDRDYVGEGPNVPMPTAAAHRRADEAQAAILEQQRVLAEQLHALRMTRSARETYQPGTRGTPLSPAAAARIAAHRESCRRELVRDLRSPTSLRRAILLREILGPPLALQPTTTKIPRV